MSSGNANQSGWNLSSPKDRGLARCGDCPPDTQQLVRRTLNELGWLALALILLLAIGCRCCPCTPHYDQVVDHVVDHPYRLDHWYRPQWDVSRAGHPDWCSRFNARLCPCRCQEGSYTPPPGGPLYPVSHPYFYPGRSPEPRALSRSTSATTRPGLPPVPSPEQLPTMPSAADSRVFEDQSSAD